MGNDLQRINATLYELESPLEVSQIIDPVTITGLNLDAFLRLRVSLPATQYEYNFQYNKAPLIWDELIGGDATSTHLPDQSSIRLDNGVTPTGALTKNIGYFEWNNGCFLGRDIGGTYLTLRSYASGSIVDRKVYQSQWSEDTMTGSGSSGITMDWEKTFIMAMDFEWLGVGTVEIGFIINKTYYPVHKFHNAQILEVVYMTTANLPMRYEISDGANYVIRQTYTYFRYRPGKSLLVILTANLFGDLQYMDQICATVITEGSNDIESYYQHSVNMGITPKAIGTTKNALISVRPKQLFNSILNRSQIIHEAIDLLVIGNGTIRWELIYNATIGGTPSWNSAGTNASYEFDVSGTTLTGGEIVTSGYALSSAQVKQAISSDLSAKYPLTLDMLGTGFKNLSLAAVSFTGTIDTIASMSLREYY